jgi:purine nucleosidase
MEAEQKNPGILAIAKDIIVMGGAFECPGNITPHAEFNVFHNPESYNFVLKYRSDFVFIPLDITSTILLEASQVQTLKGEASQTPSGDGPTRAHKLVCFLEKLTQFQIKQSLAFKQTKGQAAMQMHDPATVAFMMYPNLFLW